MTTTTSDSTEVRGLILKQEHAKRFLTAEDVGHPAQKKTLELRSHKLWCVPSGGVIYILASGHGKNEQGFPVLPCFGVLEFVGNEQIEMDRVKDMFHDHFCTADEFAALKKKWKRPDGKVNGWRVKLLQAFHPCKFLIRPVGEAG